MKLNIFAITPLVALAACGSGDKVEMQNASVSEVADKMKKQAGERFVEPGSWEQKVTLLSIEAPGMPPQAKEMMSKAFGEAQVHNVCLTEAEANRPREDFFTGADRNCRYDHFNWGEGKIDLKLDCRHSGARQVMELTGTYQPRSYEMAMTMTSSGIGGGEGEAEDQRMVMKMRVDARRTGACTPAQKQAETAP